MTQKRRTYAVLQLSTHPYFETRDGAHAHLVHCDHCQVVTLEAGEITTCQVCGDTVTALDLDIALHMANGDYSSDYLGW